ncbi:hypothetical protein BDY17DRAFT_303520 [Neohortaea acidophila]|uniref:Uncharacterized protein n=1 Tax=Neohortaea acidophila TaxID=245834 RepID=A0A6A6PKD1_9PEZI|nr:uncharacterized protein BDY17DRAFT_303520 [Neohortaea acidophila]KAF2480256.1 hypothetical protein BDY17DRAFT_303520 [Neohortaea acidophila]
MVSWKTIQSIVIFFGPILVPRLIAYYRSLRSTPASQIRPLPPATSYALAVLFASALTAFASTLPLFHPTNIFRQTQSRLQTPAGVLLTRLASIRPLTSSDETLRRVLDTGGLDARLLYARFGPSVLINCPFAAPGAIDSSRNYLLYAAPTLLAPHLLHLLVLGIATSRFLSGAEGARWRTIATIAGLLLPIFELWLVANYDDRANARSTRLGEVDFVYWKALVWRGLAIAGTDAVLGWVMWLQATHRAFLTPVSNGERVGESTRMVEMVLGKVRGLGMVRNGSARDAGLRRKVESYWVKEGEVMKDVFEQPEVLQAQRNALARVDINRIGTEADAYIDSILGRAM